MIKLLLVEDDANLSYIIQGGLEDMIGGYEVIIACNGKEGLEKYRQVKPDIIVADIEMPVMDDYEMVRRIRETDRELPILFSSARVSPKDVVKGYELGVDNYVKKPFLPEELDAHVRALLRMKQGNTEKVKNQTWTIGGYTLDPAQATLHHISGSSQLLTPRENGILELLFRNREKLSAVKLLCFPQPGCLRHEAPQTIVTRRKSQYQNDKRDRSDDHSILTYQAKSQDIGNK